MVRAPPPLSHPRHKLGAVEVSIERRDALRAELAELETARRAAEREAATVDQLRHAVKAARWERDARTSPQVEVARQRVSEAEGRILDARMATDSVRAHLASLREKATPELLAALPLAEMDDALAREAELRTRQGAVGGQG